MKYAKTLLLIVLLLGLCSLGIRRIVSGTNTAATIPSDAESRANTAVTVPSNAAQGSPFGIAPQKDLFVIEEDDMVIVNVFAECPIGTPNTAKVEFLPPSPRFINVGFPCRCENCNGSIIGLGIVPRKGDAGKYQVNLRVTSCSGFTQDFSFKVKVKKAGSA